MASWSYRRKTTWAHNQPLDSNRSTTYISQQIILEALQQKSNGLNNEEKVLNSILPRQTFMNKTDFLSLKVLPNLPFQLINMAKCAQAFLSCQSCLVHFKWTRLCFHCSLRLGRSKGPYGLWDRSKRPARFTCRWTLVKFTHTGSADRLPSEAKRWSDVTQAQHEREGAVTCSIILAIWSRFTNAVWKWTENWWRWEICQRNLTQTSSEGTALEFSQQPIYLAL